MFKTGFAQVNINEGIDFVMGGMFLEYKSEKVHTPLYASAWALEDESTKVIWVSCDLVVVQEKEVDKIKKGVEKETGVPASNINVSATHTHSGPSTINKSIYNQDRDDSFFDELLKRIIDSCVSAWNNRTEAYMGYGSSEVEKACYNRRYMMENGVSRMHPGGKDFPGRLCKEGPEDRQLQVLWFEDDEGVKGVVVNYTSHPSTLYGLKVISSDFPGVMRRVIQSTYGDVPVLFLQGCCGNTSTVNHAEDPEWWGDRIEGTERVGIILGGEVIKLIASVRPERKAPSNLAFISSSAKLIYKDIEKEDIEESEKVSKKFKRVVIDGVARIVIEGQNYDVAALAMANKIKKLDELKKQSPYYEASITALIIDDVAFVTNPAELFVEYQLNMKERIKANKVIAVELTNGGCIYVPTKHGYLFKGYESDQCLFDWNAGQTIEDTCVSIANQLIDDI